MGGQGPSLGLLPILAVRRAWAGVPARSIEGPVRGAVVAVLLVLSAVLVVGSAAGPASAHTDLIQGSPGPGQRIGGEVDFVDLIYAAPVSEVEVTVLRPDGTIVPGETVIPDGQIIRHEMDALTDPGRYLVEYQMISDDGDFTLGSYFFDYDEAAVAPIRLGQLDVPDEPILETSYLVGAALSLILLGACFVLLRRLRRSQAALAARRTEQSV